MKLYLKRNDENVAKNKANGNDRLPYFSLAIVPEKDGGNWVELASFWKSKSGKGYNGVINKKLKVDVTTVTLTDAEVKQIQGLREATNKVTDISAEDIQLD